MAEMLRKEIQDLLINQDFTKGLLELDDESKVKNYFSVNGKVDLTDDEVKQVKQSVKGVMDKVATLPEAELDQVAGGEVDGAPINIQDRIGALNGFMPKRPPEDSPILKPPSTGPASTGPASTIVPGPETPAIPEATKGLVDKFKELPTWGKGLAIGVPVAAAVAGIGAGVYAFGRKKGWWSK